MTNFTVTVSVDVEANHLPQAVARALDVLRDNQSDFTMVVHDHAQEKAFTVRCLEED